MMNIVEVSFIPENSGIYSGVITIVTDNTSINISYSAIVANALKFKQR